MFSHRNNDFPRELDGEAARIEASIERNRAISDGALNGFRQIYPAAAADQYQDGRFSTWMEHYLQDVVRLRVKESSYQSYRRITRNRLLPYFGGNRLDEITDVGLNRFYSGLLEDGLSPMTARMTVRLLRAALSDACRKGYVNRVPCCGYQRLPQREARVLSVAAQRALTAIALEDRALFCLLGLYAGLRVGEICALRWRDWDAECATLYVRASVQRETGRGLVLCRPKSEKSIRHVPIPESFARALEAAHGDRGPNEFICGGEKPADPRTIQRQMERLCQKAHLSGVHMHTLRHSYATRLLEAGVDVKTLSTLLGHSSVQITMNRYCHTSFEQMQRAVSRFDSYMHINFG